MALRAFPVLYAKQVERLADFYTRLGFAETFRLPDESGNAGFYRAPTRDRRTRNNH